MWFLNNVFTVSNRSKKKTNEQIAVGVSFLKIRVEFASK